MDTDVIIAGGGLVGNALAIALAQGGIRVTVIDPLPREEQLGAAFDGRTSAISSASVQILSYMGVWKHIAPDAQAIHDIRVCDQDKPGYVHYSDKDVGEPFGYIVENNHIRRGLYIALEGEKNITVIQDKVVEYSTNAASATAMLESGRSLTAPLLVAADGRFSKLRDKAAIPNRVIAYQQTAIVCLMEHEHPHAGMALEKFYPSGPFAVLPLVDKDISGDAGKPSPSLGRGLGEGLSPPIPTSEQVSADPHPNLPPKKGEGFPPEQASQGEPAFRYRSGIVWTERDWDAPHYLALSDTEFDAELQRRVGDPATGYWGKVRAVGKRFSYPLKLMHADTFYSERFILVGDAAHGVHPIAGQGVNLGYRDVAVLEELLVNQHRLGLDLGAESVLKHYQRWRRFDSMTMTAGTDILTRLFSNRIPGLSLIRRAGMVAVNHTPPLKKYFMRHAMGMLGDLPRMLKKAA